MSIGRQVSAMDKTMDKALIDAVVYVIPDGI